VGSNDAVRRQNLLGTPANPVGQVESMNIGLYLPQHMAELLYLFSAYGFSLAAMVIPFVNPGRGAIAILFCK
jgi:hypothetical protein